jgi:protein SCO1/2
MMGESMMQDTNFKSILLEYVQAQGRSAQRYVVLEEKGPDHVKEFTVAVFVDNDNLGVGTGKSKKMAEQKAAQVALEQKLNSQLPLDAKFVDENNNEVELGKYFGKKPIILALVYYECPMLCNEVLNGLVGTLKPLNFDAGKEFDIVAISFNPKETPELARAKKESYLARYQRETAEQGWHFLTGSSEQIDRVTEAVGFNYEWDEASKQYAHAGGIMIATPEGKLSHYFYGIEYAPKEVRLGLIEASDNKIGNSVDQLLLYCYHYDPSSGKYGFMIMRVLRVAGLFTVMGIAAMIFFMWRYKDNQKRFDKGNLA